MPIASRYFSRNSSRKPSRSFSSDTAQDSRDCSVKNSEETLVKSAEKQRNHAISMNTTNPLSAQPTIRPADQTEESAMASPPETILSIRDLCFGYTQSLCLSQINLAIRTGEIVCLVGSSGCGKSTLLRLISGLETPQKGQISIGGEVMSTASFCLPPEERKVGLVFQDGGLFPHLTVLENVMFGLKKLRKQQKVEIARYFLQMFQMQRFADAYPYQLSGGQQQRVGLARSLAARPRFVMLDEPFAHLDTGLRQKLREDTVHILRKENMTALIVTHDPGEAMYMADRIIFMHDGKVVQDSPPEEIYHAPNCADVAGFWGQINKFSALREGHKVRCACGSFPLPNHILQTELYKDHDHFSVIFRPEIVKIAAPGQFARNGHIIRHRFLGDHCVVQIRLTGPDSICTLYSKSSPCLAYQDGDEVSVEIPHNQIFIFPEGIARE